MSNHIRIIVRTKRQTTGPLTVAAYMRQCLTNPDGGYYINRDPLGQAGDFITSPEISQMFGELIGIWIFSQWYSVLGQPKKCRFVELGPGRGTLMADILRALQSLPLLKTLISDLYLVEASPTLSKSQLKTLCGPNAVMTDSVDGVKSSTTVYGYPIHWVQDLKQVPDEESISPFIVAHEFFDALPIHQFEHTKDGWRELFVDYSVPKSAISLPGQTTISGTASQTSGGETFHLTIPAVETVSARVVPKSSPRYNKLPVLSRIEVSPESLDYAKEIGKRVSQRHGTALIIDYGPADTVPVDTLRGIQKHHTVSPFDSPGEADLSADVDFTALKLVAEEQAGVAVHGPVEQGDWLHTMGIGARATMLHNAQTTDEGRKRVEQAYNRLTEKSGGAMGKVYKFMSFQPAHTSVPVGFGGSAFGDEK
ncbi:S-adenosyl-L-methionine-dependent methyltransferase [Lipomyces oligophaga]|uniref:S-adenosyl-L-methionine-dependent methyltransferase n=1 Tax=Lipomyces oligophaga TaxID=45792 RepID=UPI0034CFE76F